MLGSIRAIKMSGLTLKMSNTLKSLRSHEMITSRKFKYLLVVIVALCESVSKTWVFIIDFDIG